VPNQTPPPVEVHVQVLHVDLRFDDRALERVEVGKNMFLAESGSTS
jgi:hypothetical protein